jgi:hypothetical protein
MEQGFIFRERRASISTKPDGEQSEFYKGVGGEIEAGSLSRK